jgi:hypothetical protein
MNKRANPAVIGGFVVGAVALAVLGVVAFVGALLRWLTRTCSTSIAT